MKRKSYAFALMWQQCWQICSDFDLFKPFPTVVWPFDEACTLVFVGLCLSVFLTADLSK